MNSGLTRKQMWYWLCNIRGIGLKKRKCLIDYFGDIESVYHAADYERDGLLSLNKADKERILQSKCPDTIKTSFDKLASDQIHFTTQEDEEYPKLWKELYDAPYGFYYKGRLPLCDKLSIAIVGARDASIYGQEMALYFGRKLARAGMNVISGMARGIDGYSQRGALEGGGYSAAILGCGVDYCYPIENWELYQQLIQRGGVLSEYAPGTLPRAGNFPMRNRLISGMSQAVLVIEARVKSGSFITVDTALEQGKDVFVIPGRVTDDRSQGCLKLIQMGGTMVSSPDDILEYYHIQCDKKDIACDQINLNEKEEKILHLLTNEPKHINQIMELGKLSLGETMGELVQLELKSLIYQPVKNYFALKI
ncbi:rossmann fold nucleotide-binding protein Smf possibly [Lachnospiraceae bacterium KM106-2]|nr:rossmann fold nucleotide-binding protein Smf possibly [Lachnospiraceae bacterium KM106-2]